MLRGSLQFPILTLVLIRMMRVWSQSLFSLNLVRLHSILIFVINICNKWLVHVAKSGFRIDGFPSNVTFLYSEIYFEII